MKEYIYVLLALFILLFLIYFSRFKEGFTIPVSTPLLWTMTKDTNYPYNDIGTSVSGKTPTECMQLCYADATCKGVQYSISDGRCWKKLAAALVPSNKQIKTDYYTYFKNTGAVDPTAYQAGITAGDQLDNIVAANAAAAQLATDTIAQKSAVAAQLATDNIAKDAAVAKAISDTKATNNPDLSTLNSNVNSINSGLNVMNGKISNLNSSFDTFNTNYNNHFNGFNSTNTVYNSIDNLSSQIKMNTDKLGNFVGPNDLYSTLGKFSSTNTVYNSIDNLSSQVNTNTGILNSIVSALATLQSNVTDIQFTNSIIEASVIPQNNSGLCITNFGTKVGEYLYSGSKTKLTENESELVCPYETPICNGYDLSKGKFGTCK